MCQVPESMIIAYSAKVQITISCLSGHIFPLHMFLRFLLPHSSLFGGNEDN